MKGFIERYATASLVITAGLALLTFIIQANTGECLKTDLTPGGILSLEFAWQQEYADALRNEWKKLCEVSRAVCVNATAQSRIIDAAILNIYWDFAFMVCYFMLFYVLAILHESKFARISRKPHTAPILFFCMLIFLLDGIENVLMLNFLNGIGIDSWKFALAASIKFSFIAVVTLYILWRGSYLKRFSEFTTTLTHILWHNRVSVVGLIVLYFALWKSDQGQDLLINLNASHWGPITLYIILSILATFYWYWPKYFSHEKWTTPSRVNVSLRSLFCGNWNSPGNSAEVSYVPRLLGLLTFIVPACGILQALTIFQISYPLDFIDPLVLLIISITFFLVMMENRVFDLFFDKTPKLFYGTLVLLLAVILGLGFLNKYSAHQLGLLTVGLFSIAFLFIMLTSVRSRKDFYRGWALKKLEGMRANTWMLSFVTAAAILFFAFNCYPHITANGPYRFITLPVVLTAIVFYSLVFFLLMIWGKKKGINFSAFLIVFSIVIAVVVDNSYHDIKTVERVTKSALPSLSDYMHQWVLSREGEILRREGTYPVFIVNSYGGGIRAAAWASLAVSFLDSITDNKFQDHVLAYSGASGGTIGSSVLTVVRRNEMMESFRTRHVKKFYQNDFLTPALIGLFGRDIWFSTLGISWFDDRARVHEKIWEKHILDLDSTRYYSSEFSSVWYPNATADYKIPLLFSNTYHVETGLKAVLAPVSLDTAQFESAVVVNNLLKDKSVLFSTGSFLSARFPFISPAGKLDDDHHFLDGGLKENSGAETAEEIYKVFQKLADTVHRRLELPANGENISNDSVRYLYSKIRIYFLSLNNSVPETDDPGPSRNLVELTAPFQALYNNWVGNTSKADSVLRLRHERRYFELRPTATCVDGFRPVLPLGWQISDRAIAGMIQSLKVPCSNNVINIGCIKGIVEEDIRSSDCGQLSLPCDLANTSTVVP
jgi:hypothetical protein